MGKRAPFLKDLPKNQAEAQTEFQAGLQPKVRIPDLLKKRKKELEEEGAQATDADALSVSDAPQVSGEPPIQLAQTGVEAATVIDAAAATTAGGTATGTAAATTTATGFTAAGTTAAASGAAAASTVAATSAAAATTTTLTTAASIGGATSVAGVAGGAVALGAAAGGGGGGGGGGSDGSPEPLPPANPFPSSDGSSPGLLDLGGGSSGAGPFVSNFSVQDNVAPTNDSLPSWSPTNDKTPTFNFQAPPGQTIKIYNGDKFIGFAQEDPDNPGNYSFTPREDDETGGDDDELNPDLSEGINSITWTVTPPGGTEGPKSDPFVLNVDTTAPRAPLVDAVRMPAGGLPEVSGYARLAPSETLEVVINGATYSVTPNANGFWSLDLATAQPTSGVLGTFTTTPGNYPVVATAIDPAGNRTEDTTTNEVVIYAPSGGPAPLAPTVEPIFSTGSPAPQLSGTLQLTAGVLPAGQTFSVVVNGATYTYSPGKPGFTINPDGTWSLDLQTATPTSGTLGSFTAGTTYPVRAEVTQGANTSFSTAPWVAEAPPPTKPTAPTSYQDNSGASQSSTSNDPVTDDTTPGINIGPGLTPQLTPKLYVNGIPVPATYDPATGTLTPTTPLPPGNYEFTYSVTNDSGNESPTSDPFSLVILPTNPLSTFDGPVHRLSVSGTSFPTGILNNSLVVDLGATFGVYQNTLYYTERVGQEVVTRAVSYRDINDVNGTTVNDQISGNARANILSGGAGDDIIYGDGGADTLRGGAGQDWILFKPLTRGSGASPYNGGVLINLTNAAGSYSSITFEATGFEHVVGSDGNDTIVGNNADNILDGAGGDDTINGGAGNDHLFGGSSLSGGIGNQLTGGTGRDTFWVGYEINPVTRSRDSSFTGTTELASDPRVFDPILSSVSVREVSNSSTIHDWNFAQDRLRVSFSGVAIIGGLEGVTWAGSNTVDVSTASNEGLIKIAAGTGTNNIYLSAGSDQVWTGYAYTVNSGVANGSIPPSETATPSASATDILWGWDNQSGRRDALNVSQYSQAVIALLQGKADWSGNDTVDLRSNVTNSGTIIISTESGSNTVYGSAGIDLIYGSANGGTNQVWGGLGADIFYVGTRRIASTGTTSTVASRDLIWDWESTDQLNVASGATAVIAGLMASAWTIPNTVDLTGKATNNGTIIIALGDLDDTFTGSSGVDDIYGGTSTDAGNMIRGGLGSDHFYVGFNYNPNTNTRSELGPTDTAIDVILDWEDADNLTVGTRGQAIIGGLYDFANFTTSGWNLANAVNLSHATNNGIIKIAMGAGINQVTASTGVDHFFVGSYFPGTSSLTIAPSTATDVIYGWDSQGTSADFLTVSTVGTAVIGALLGQTSWSNRTSWSDVNGWSGNDTVDLRRQVNNAGLIQVASGAGSNSIYGSSGSDHFYVGYTNDVNGVAQTLPSLSRATDIIYGWDSTLWNSEPFAGTWSSGTNWNGSTNTSDLTYDRLTVAIGSTARIGSLANQSPTDLTRWDSVNRVDLRSNVSNLNIIEAHGGGIEIWTGAGSDYVFGSTGRDLIYSGPGLDNLWGGDGNDVFYVGYSPSWAQFGADAAEPRIWDWQNKNSTSLDVGSAGSPGDGLRIAPGSFVIIQGLWGMDSASSTSKEVRWSGNNIVDLRWDVVNKGKIILETGAGDDTIYGSSGVDYINPGSGTNTIVLHNGGADRVYLDTFQTKTQIAGFDLSDDLIYLDTRVLDSFKLARAIVLPSGYNKTTSANDQIDVNLITDGRTDRPGELFPLSSTVFNSVYNGELSNYSEKPRDPDGAPSYGWNSNGAYNNSVYESIWPLAVTGVSTTAFGFYTTAAGLSLIPIVGPVLAIGPLTIAGLMAADAGQSLPYLNAVYPGVQLDSGVSVLSNDKTVTSSIGTFDQNGVFTKEWDAPNFLDFYNVKLSTREYAPSLEFSAHQSPSTITGPLNTEVPNPTLYGVASYLIVHSDTETFIYLVASKDGLIQDNEAILIAQINGLLTASQIRLYNGDTDTEYLRYFDNDVAPPVFPAKPTISGITAGNVDKTVVTQDGIVYTNDTKLNVTVTIPINFVSTDRLIVYLDGVKQGTPITPNSGTKSFTFSLDISKDPADSTEPFSTLADGTHVIKVALVNKDGLFEETTQKFTKDTKPPDSTFLSVSELSDNILYVSSNEAGKAKLGTNEVSLIAVNAFAGSLVVDPTSSATPIEERVSFFDVLGQSTTSATVIRGSNSDNIIASNTTDFIFGFDGNDTISTTLTTGSVIFGGNGTDTITGGVGSDRLFGGSGNDSITGGDGADSITGGTGIDLLTGGGGSDRFIFSAGDSNAIAGNLSVHSTGQDTISDWSTDDTIVLSGTVSANFDFSNDIFVGNASGMGSLNVSSVDDFSKLTYLVDLDGTDDTFELAIKVTKSTGDAAFANSAAAQAATALNIQLDDVGRTVIAGVNADTIFGGAGADTISGGAGADTISGGGGADTITGGSGADSLTGGSGADRFIFNSGDSNTVAGNSTFHSTGQDTISDWSTGDLIVLSGTVAANFDIATDVLVGVPAGNGSSNMMSVGDFSSDTYLVDLNGQDSNFELAIKITNTAGGVAFANSAAAQAATALNIQLDNVGRTVIAGVNADTIFGGTGNDSIAGGAGVDTISGGDGADTITGGTGADVLTGGDGNDRFIFAAGDSNVDSFDKISGVGLVQNAGNKDTIDLVGNPTVYSNAGATNGTDFGLIKSHTISNGVVNFDDEDAFSNALTDFTLAHAVGYLQANIAGEANDGKAVVFKLGLNSYLFQNNENSNDLLIEFTNTTIDGLTTDSLVVTTNYLFIA